jgi:hypothetical protein
MAEMNAIAHAYMGTTYGNIFTSRMLKRCGCD